MMRFVSELSHGDRSPVPIKITADYDIYSGYFGTKLRVLKPLDKRMIRLIQREGVDNLEFLASWIKPDFNLTLLGELERLRFLTIHSDWPLDWAPLQSLQKLRGLKLRTGGLKPQNLEFRRFGNLQSCSIQWHPEWASVLQCKTLRHLSLERSQHVAEFDFSGLLHLREVRIVGCNGLKRISFSPRQAIESLEITATKALHTISPVRILDGVKYLAIGGNVRFDIRQIRRCRGLRRLWLNSVGKIPSLQFLRGSSQLEFLQMLFSTDVGDGDLGVLAGLPRLRSVMYKHRAHYSHRRDALNKLLQNA